MTQRTISTLIFAAAAMTALTGISCNMTGGIDNARSRDETILDAQAKMDNGDCTGAITILNNVVPQDDRSLQILGSAYLCSAGATVKQVDAALGQYDSSSNNITVIGILANNLVPPPSGADANIALAINAFNLMSQTNTKVVWQIYGNLVRVASLMAKASSNSATVVRTDISPSACAGQSCSTGPAQCSAQNMSDADANTALSALQAAATASNAATGTLGAIKSLPTNLNQLLGGSATVNATRCVLVNNTLTQ